MRKKIPFKLFTRLLLLVMLAVTINGEHESVHALQNSVAAAEDQEVHSALSAPHQCPCTPFEGHKDYDDCDTCVNCACHASLTVQPLKLVYNPIIVALNTYDPFKFLPKVYLVKFIPPQIHV